MWAGNVRKAALINKHVCSDGRHVTEFLRCGDRDTDASMARRPRGHRATAVNSHAFNDVVRVIQHSQRALVPPGNLAIHGEFPPWRNGSSPSSFGSEPFSAA